jgi:hypothetical protein
MLYTFFNLVAGFFILCIVVLIPASSIATSTTVPSVCSNRPVTPVAPAPTS